jgi:AraC-like DNA-binding protein
MQKNLPASYVRLILRHFKNNALSVDMLLADTGFSEDMLAKEQNVAVSLLLIVMRKAREISASPTIGLVLGKLLHPSTHGSVGWAMINSQTLKQAIDVFIKYSIVRTPFFQYSCSVKESAFCIQLIVTQDLEDIRQLLIECVLLLLKNMIDYIIGCPTPEMKIMVDYTSPEYIADYDSHFKCDFKFQQPGIEIRLPVSFQDRINSTADSYLYGMALDQCQMTLNKMRREQNIISQIIDIIEQNLILQLSLEKVAQQLNITSRTLARLLAKLGTSFKSISDDTYAAKASELLKTTDISINSISIILGFSEPSNFRRSFKRWLGEPPNVYRGRYNSIN